MAGLEDKDTVGLSGGQKQRTAIASVLALRPRLLLLDEPVSQLDPQGSLAVMTCVGSLPEKAGCTVIVAEHRLHDLYAAGVLREGVRAVVLEKGRVVFDGDVREAVDKGVLEACGVREPGVLRVARSLYGRVPTLDRGELMKLLASSREARTIRREHGNPGPPLVRVSEVWVRYSKRDEFALRGVSLEIRRGEVAALMGPNASGKTTLMRTIAGLLKPERGNVELNLDAKRDIAYVPQNPDLFLVSDTVAEELRLNPRGGSDPRLIGTLVSELGLEKLLDAHPHTLSRGQRFRVAVAAALAGEPKLVMLDEPTTGQDENNIEALARVLREYLASRPSCALISTHDVEFALHHCSKVVVLKEGRVLAQGHPWEILGSEDVVREACLRPPDEILVGA